MTPKEHYGKTFHLKAANTTEEKETSFNIRYQVYCQEFNYEQLPEGTAERETDEYDEQSQHCLLIHNASQRPIGCARLVTLDSNASMTELPFWKYCRHAIDTTLFNPSNFAHHQLVEFSRVAIIEQFRRREKNAEHTGIDQQNIQQERRLSNFPVLPVSLFLATLAMFLDTGAEYGVAMMEPKLVRLLRKSGIFFEQVGQVVDYHGKRAPFIIHRNDVRRHFSAEVLALFDEIHRQWHEHYQPV